MGVRVRFYKGAWYVFIAHRGRRRAKKIGDRETALAVAKKVRERLALGDLNLLASEPTETFQTYATTWLKGVAANRKTSTHAFYEFNLRLHLYPVLGAKAVSAVTRADCREVLSGCRANGLKLASLQGVQRTLSVVLSQAVEDGLLTTNPAFRMGKYLGAGDAEPVEISPLTRLEAQAFLETTLERYPDLYAFFLSALRTGLRLGELLALTWDDVDLAGRSITARRNRVRGKITSTKNRQRRAVDMSLKLAEALRKLRVQQKAASLKAGRAAPSWVFTTPEGAPLDGDNLRRREFARILEAAKDRVHPIRIHDLRHTYATHLIQQGESLAYVSRQLGHSSIKITVDTYGHWLPNADRSAVDRLDAEAATDCNPDATEARRTDVAGEAK